MTSRVDYCNAILAGSSKSITDKLQRLLNVAVRIVSDTRKYDHGLSHIFYTRSCTGWMFLSECSSSSTQLSTSVCSPQLYNCLLYTSDAADE